MPQRPSRRPPGSSSQDRLKRNRRGWDHRAKDYQERVGPALYPELGWGPNHFPERELRVLGDVRGKRVIEVACGGAQFGIFLAKAGALVTGIDLSLGQLRYARRNIKAAGVAYDLHRGNAEDLSRFRGGTFDIVVSDFAAGFLDLDALLPEVRRVLRPGGICVLSWASPMLDCLTLDGSPPLLKLVRSYFDRTPFVEGGEDPTWEFVRTYGDWVRAFVKAGLVLEDLIEPQAPRGASHTDWPQYRWQRTHYMPGTAIWKARKPKS
jgi:ubiquinone/menaquinone biosynthesis C-methylase UbiE